ncbi:MAG TPA: transketolase, partial [Burkholderiales bacterium]|nr:transketolase [Burkholderiales bacterium]
RFAACGWHTCTVDDGNDLAAIDAALRDARAETQRPSLILVRTHIGYGSPNMQDTFKAHGSPLGEEEVRLTKQNLEWPEDPPFYMPEQALQHFREAVERGRNLETQWDEKFAAYAKAFPDVARELQQTLHHKLPDDWNADIPVFSPDDKGMATRVASGKVMNAIAPRLPALIGGSADLDPSTHTALENMGDFQRPGVRVEDRQGSGGGDWNYAGRNLHFGVREHAMGAILNGLAAHGGIVPFGATFLIFSDYMRPPMRLAALMGLHVIYVFTHDSIALGQDGPTHQPVEQLAGLRAVPDLIVIRPADANETAVAWQVALETTDHPVALILTRQKVPTFDREQLAAADGVRRGAYVLTDAPGGEPDAILIASGSEVGLIAEARLKLDQNKIRARVVSMPSWELFDAQPQAYRDSVLPHSTRIRLAVEAGSPQGWHRYVGEHGDVLGIERFGESAPGQTMLDKYGFTVDNVCARLRALLEH